MDEAHHIRDRSTAVSRAIQTIDARFRWAVTSTPVLNHPADIASLVRFIRVHQYSSSRALGAQLLGSGSAQVRETDIKRLQSSLRLVMLRRPRGVLPLKRENLRLLDLAPAERVVYDQLLKDMDVYDFGSQLLESMGEYELGEELSNTSITVQYINAFARYVTWGSLHI